MNSIKNSSQLKSSARKYLSGHYSQVVLAQLFFIAFSALLSMLSATDPTATIVSVVISFVISYICTCNIEILRFGLYRMYMNLCCGYRFSVRDMYYGFFVKTQRPTFLAVLLTSIQYLSMLPFYILLFLYTASKDTFLLTATIISFLIGIFVYYILSLALSQSYFLLLDFPDKPLKEILKLSCWMMKGQKLRLFRLQLSFLPLMFLGILSCGVGLLWVTPYLNTTYTCFHLNLASAKAKE